MTVSNNRLDEWGLLAELEKKGHFLRVSPSITCPINELKPEDVDWFKVGYIASKEGYDFPTVEGDDVIRWVAKSNKDT